ncbi:hypothetical protein RASY3_00820 [Ruminococcus albus SY3]|uniref:ATP-grasp domain-containing protein n=1 Tax=Ruminococcus albus SY3 TaxID=1341156 RepID=A0A011WV78_RUMAL|nr:ATP-grasp domain-containing protein [Ruminococcus albus]EXM40910.1 hypothetical protein RASY3_00820 [Ruminococcus albus SY3]
MQHRLVIIGSLYENVQLVIEAKRRGYYTIVCDGYKNGHAKNIADKYYDIDIRDTEKVAEMCIREKADGILGSFSDLVFEKITEIAHKAGIEWYASADMLKYYRDKKQAKDLLRSLGVSVPENRIINKDFSDEDIKGLSFPLVVKPSNAWGSKGIYVVNNSEELRLYAEKSAEISHSEQVLVEEYSKGGEYNITSFVAEGKVYVISCGDREKTRCEDKSIPRLSRIFYNTSRHDDIIEAARVTLQKFADAVGQKYGVLSMQCFFYKGTLTVCEIAGRILAFENDIIGAHSGLSINQLLLDCVYDKAALKEKLIQSRGYVPSKLYARLYFFAYDGHIIENMDNVYELCKYDKLTDDIVFYNEGEKIDNRSTRSYFATFSFTADSIADMDRTTDHFAEKMKVFSTDGKNIICPIDLDNDRDYK